MRVLLIMPNSWSSLKPIPLGLGYLAGALRRLRGDRVKILDARHRKLSESQVASAIRDFSPEIVGITAMSAEYKVAHAYAALARAHAPGAKVILGGPYPSAHRETVLSDPNLDLAVVGEGEVTLAEILNTLEGGGDLGKVRGVLLREDGLPRFTGHRGPILDLDAFSPAWDLMDLPSYFKIFGSHTGNRFPKHHRRVSLFTSRGCPYQCIYCHQVFDKKFRARSAESVVGEIAMLRERYGVREVEILDDCFNQSRKRAADICHMLTDRCPGMAVSIPTGVRGDLMDPELIGLFKEAGVFRVSVAVETASQRLQAVIKKNLNLEKVRQAIHHFVANKIITVGLFMMGLPTETFEEMMATARFAAESDLHMAWFLYLNPFPGTQVAEMTGIDARQMEFPTYMFPPVNLSAATDQQLRYAYNKARLMFYANPKRALRTFSVLPKNIYQLTAFRAFFDIHSLAWQKKSVAALKIKPVA